MKTKRYNPTGIILLIGLFLFVSCVSAAQVTISSVMLDTDGKGTATLVMDQAPEGLAGFKIDISIADTSVSDAITVVSYPAGFDQFDTNHVYTNPCTQPFQSGYIKAMDLSGTSFPDGSTDILLANVTIHGLSAGTTTLHGDIDVMTDNSGGNMKTTTTVQDGTIIVKGQPGIARIYEVTLPGQTSPPIDPDGDGLYEDLNGDHLVEFTDVSLYFTNFKWIQQNEPTTAFDFNGNGVIDFSDIVLLNEKI